MNCTENRVANLKTFFCDNFGKKVELLDCVVDSLDFLVTFDKAVENIARLQIFIEMVGESKIQGIEDTFKKKLIDINGLLSPVEYLAGNLKGIFNSSDLCSTPSNINHTAYLNNISKNFNNITNGSNYATIGDKDILQHSVELSADLFIERRAEALTKHYEIIVQYWRFFNFSGKALNAAELADKSGWPIHMRSTVLSVNQQCPSYDTIERDIRYHVGKLPEKLELLSNTIDVFSSALDITIFHLIAVSDCPIEILLRLHEYYSEKNTDKVDKIFDTFAFHANTFWAKTATTSPASILQERLNGGRLKIITLCDVNLDTILSELRGISSDLVCENAKYIMKLPYCLFDKETGCANGVLNLREKIQFFPVISEWIEKEKLKIIFEDDFRNGEYERKLEELFDKGYLKPYSTDKQFSLLHLLAMSEFGIEKFHILQKYAEDENRTRGKEDFLKNFKIYINTKDKHGRTPVDYLELIHKNNSIKTAELCFDRVHKLMIFYNQLKVGVTTDNLEKCSNKKHVLRIPHHTALAPDPKSYKDVEAFNILQSLYKPSESVMKIAKAVVLYNGSDAAKKNLESSIDPNCANLMISNTYAKNILHFASLFERSLEILKIIEDTCLTADKHATFEQAVQIGDSISALHVQQF